MSYQLIIKNIQTYNYHLVKNLRLLFFLITIGFTVNLTAQSVYTTKTGEKYHKVTCRYLKYSKKEITLKKAIEYGYNACSVCKPGKGSKTSKVVSTSKTTKKASTAQTKKSVAIQCSGKTKSGSRCKRKTKNTNGKCYQHK